MGGATTVVRTSIRAVDTARRTDSWRATSTGLGAPSSRIYHTAVWTGTKMIVWGGLTEASLANAGGRYDPSTDSWATTSNGPGVPSDRIRHTAVWTGTEMVVWGGWGFADENTGGRYNPATDTWTPTSLGAGIPSARAWHVALWNGTEMIVWGGQHDEVELQTGCRYNPLTDAWTETSIGVNVPSARHLHTLAWTGSQMIVWGGYPLDSGLALYCASACPSPRTSYRDVDADGYGNPFLPTATCDGSIPSGYVVSNTDCNDTNALVHPGVPELCNGLDDDCDNAIDDGIVVPAGSMTILGAKSGASVEFSWSALLEATGYDVVIGSLTALVGSSGNFAVATTGCLYDELVSTTASDATTPALGDRFWYLVRPVNCRGAGSFDTGSAGQLGSRDAEIAASEVACP